MRGTRALSLVAAALFLTTLGACASTDATLPSTAIAREPYVDSSLGGRPTTGTAGEPGNEWTDEGSPLYEWPADVSESERFWRGLRIAGFEIPLFRTVEDLAASATIVAVGVPVGVGPSISLGGDPDNNETVSSFTVIVELKEVVRSRAHLHGVTEPRAGDRVTVIVDRRPAEEFPDAPVLLFLRAPGDNRYYHQVDPADIAPDHRDYYRATLTAWEAFRVGKYDFVNSQSILVGDRRTTVNPMRDPADDPLADVISDRPISEIVDLIRSMPAP
ncbi:MAG: hypothetical protein WEA29_03235 [Acidimicrobiia bacterium]